MDSSERTGASVTTLSDTVECRIKRTDLFLSLLIFALGLVFLSPLVFMDRKKDDVYLAVCAVPILLGACWHAAYVLRARIVADDRGLRWRGVVKWKSLRWNEVIGYYEKRSAIATKPWYEIEGASTKLTVAPGGSGWTNLEELKRIVAQNAGKSETIAWQSDGAILRPGVEKQFHYATKSNKYALGILLAVTAVCLGGFCYMIIPVLLNPPDYLRFMSLGMKVAMLVMVLLLALMCPTIYGAILLPIVRDYRYRKLQLITVSSSSICLQDRGTLTDIPWEDVKSYIRVPGPGLAYERRYTVRSEKESIEFTSSISDVDLLRDLVESFASTSGQTEWRTLQNPEILGGEASLWTSGTPGIGDRVFHYRTRTIRSMLWCFGALPVTMTGIRLQNHYYPIPDAAGPPPAFIIVLSLAVWIYLWLVYRTSRIILTEAGVEYLSLFTTERIDWTEISALTRKGSDPPQRRIVEGGGKRIVFYELIGGYAELKQEIRKRGKNVAVDEW
ncbi:MAG: hypothetical protein WCL39_10965 [Armatimonadota bacterium]